MYNVFLSGGGMKGAYQYGFFKELFRQYPNFPIKKVYAVSVGAINSVAIVTKRTSALDAFWCHPDIHPFDTIADDWDDFDGIEGSTKSSRRFRSLIKHGSIFKQMKRGPYETFLNDMNETDMAILREKLVIISYDKVSRTSLFTECTSVEQIIDSIQSSSRFPGLFNAYGIDRVDGMFADINHILHASHDSNDSPNDRWLCIDLQKSIKHPPNKSDVYSPCISSIPGLNEVACLLSNRIMLDHLVQNGNRDAQSFIKKHELYNLG